METLLNVGILSRNQLRRLFFSDSKSHTSCNKRLSTLFKRRILNHNDRAIENLWETGLVPCGIFGLGPVGLELLALKQNKERKDLPYAIKQYNKHPDQIVHDIGYNEIYVRITEEIREIDHAKLNWVGERQGSIYEKPKGSNREVELVRPDSQFELVIGWEKFGCFLENDRLHTKWFKKIAAYNEVPLPKDKECVLVICSPKNLKSVRKKILKYMPKQAYFIKDWDDVINDDISIFDKWRDAENLNEVSIIDKEAYFIPEIEGLGGTPLQTQALLYSPDPFFDEAYRDRSIPFYLLYEGKIKISPTKKFFSNPKPLVALIRTKNEFHDFKKKTNKEFNEYQTHIEQVDFDKNLIFALIHSQLLSGSYGVILREITFYETGLRIWGNLPFPSSNISVVNSVEVPIQLLHIPKIAFKDAKHIFLSSHRDHVMQCTVIK